VDRGRILAGLPLAGNIRELEQCPAQRANSSGICSHAAHDATGPAADAHDELLGSIIEGKLTADELPAAILIARLRATEVRATAS